jgi:hypothetical protein
VAALELDLSIDCLPCGILQLRGKGDGGPLVCGQALVSPEQPDEPATLLNLHIAADRVTHRSETAAW